MPKLSFFLIFRIIIRSLRIVTGLSIGWLVAVFGFGYANEIASTHRGIFLDTTLLLAAGLGILTVFGLMTCVWIAFGKGEDEEPISSAPPKSYVPPEPEQPYSEARRQTSVSIGRTIGKAVGKFLKGPPMRP